MPKYFFLCSREDEELTQAFEELIEKANSKGITVCIARNPENDFSYIKESTPETNLAEDLFVKTCQKLIKQACGDYPRLKGNVANWLGKDVDAEGLYHHAKAEYHETSAKVEILLKLVRQFEQWDNTPESERNEDMFYFFSEKMKKRIKQLDEETLDLSILFRMVLDRFKFELERKNYEKYE